MLKLYQRTGILLLSFFTLLIAGCGESEDFVFTANNVNPFNTLTVNLDTSAPINPRISGDAVAFEVSLFDAALNLLDTQNLARGQSAAFGDLNDGTYTVRVVGLDNLGDPVGFFDRRVTIADNVTVLIDGLIYTAVLPAIGSTQTPFLIVSELPDEIVGGEEFGLQATAYDADGAVLTSAEGTVALAVNGLNLSVAPGPAAFANGVATFSDLTFPAVSEGTVVFTLSNATFGDAESPAIPVSAGAPAPFTRLAVADLIDLRIYIYDLADLTGAVNDVAPIATIGNDLDTLDNYDIDSASNGDALWFCNSELPVQLYTVLDGGAGSDEPARALTTDFGGDSLSNDQSRDILYVAESTPDGSDGVVSIFDDAFTLANGSGETRQLTLFPDFVRGVEIDEANDRLFVICGTAVAGEFELHMFENASTAAVDGDQAGVNHEVSVLTFPTDAVPFSPSYDPFTDRLWFADYDGTVSTFYFLDDASIVGATATVTSVAADANNRWAYDLFFDAISNVLFVTDNDNGAVLIYDNADTLTGPTEAPDRVLSGVQSLLDEPGGITLLP